MTAARYEDVWRACAPHVLAALVRRYGDFDAAEDAVQEALLAAAGQWPAEGMPDDPKSWLITVASRRLIDRRRADRARAERERRVSAGEPSDALFAAPPGSDDPSGRDDSLALLVLCCHPALTPSSQVALTLRAVGGLTTAQIARAFLVPEATMAQRISRAKARLREIRVRFTLPAAAELPGRVAAVAHVLYLIFTEGHTATAGGGLTAPDVADEAIRLTRRLHERLPADDEVTGLLALMLLTHARRMARTTPAGSLVPLGEQDRSRWDRPMIDEGIALVERLLPSGPVGPYQLQAAIAAVHAESPSAEATDWVQIELLYRMLEGVGPGPMVTLNHAVAVAMVDGPDPALDLVRRLLEAPNMRRNHRVHAVLGHLLEMDGRPEEARTEYAAAARLATSIPEQRYLNDKARAAIDT